MASDFYAFRVNPETDADIILMLENVPNKSDYIKACIRAAKDQNLMMNLKREDELYQIIKEV